MSLRATELAASHSGNLWHTHRDEASASINDRTNVLLLEPASSALRFSKILARPGVGDTHSRVGLVVVTLYYTKTDNPGVFGMQFDKSLCRVAEADGARTLAAYVTSSQENNYPKLRVRSGEHIFVCISAFTNADAYVTYQATLTADKNRTARWNSKCAQLARGPEVLRLTLTARSRLRG